MELRPLEEYRDPGPNYLKSFTNEHRDQTNQQLKIFNKEKSELFAIAMKEDTTADQIRKLFDENIRNH